MIHRILRKVQGMASQTAAGYLWDFLMDPGPNRHGRTPFGGEELKLVRQALASQNLCCVDGQMVPRFEKEFAMAYGAPQMAKTKTPVKKSKEALLQSEKLKIVSLFFIHLLKRQAVLLDPKCKQLKPIAFIKRYS